MRKLIAALLLSLLGALPLGSAEAVTSAFAYNIDVDSATVTFFKHVGQNENPFGGSIQGPGTVKTTGSSATVEENVASSNPFTDIAVGDLLEITVPPAASADVFRVVAKASAASITIDTAIDISNGVTWRYWSLRSGTGVDDGWFSISSGLSVTLGIYWVQGDIDDLRVVWQCRSQVPGAVAEQVFPGASSECGLAGSSTTNPGFCTYTAVGDGTSTKVQVLYGNYSECRVGLRYGTTDTSDVGAALEIVKVDVEVARSTQ